MKPFLCREFEGCFGKYEEASGQIINHQKSSILPEKRSAEGTTTEIEEVLAIGRCEGTGSS